MIRLNRSTACTLLALASGSTILNGCGQLPGFTVSQKTDEFVQVAVRNDKIDILFVVDNSGSMSEEQANLVASFGSFINKFAEKNLNFQVGVVSTDTTNNAPYWAATGAYATSSPYKNFPNAGPGTLLAYRTNERIIRPTTPNYITQFQENARLGITGSGAEAGAQSTILALSETQLSSTGWNYGFVRSDALLAVIFVSDEDESRLGSSTSSYYLRAFQSEAAARKAAFVATMERLKPSKPDLVRVDAIVSRTREECPTVGSANGLYGTGDFYMDLVQHFGSGSSRNLCQDFSEDLSNIGKDLVKMLTRFKLVQAPDGQIEVRVNGELILRDSDNGWEYFADTREVEFRGTAIPSADAKIEVTYVPGEPLR